MEGQNSEKQERVELDGTETLDEEMTPYSVNAIGFKADWKLDDMATLQRQDHVLADVIYRLGHQHKPPRSWSKDESWRSYKDCITSYTSERVLLKERYVVLTGGRREQKEALVIPGQ